MNNDKAFQSIVKQYAGGEHVNAGKRASELLYAGGDTANEDILADLREQAPGIERYIVAPDQPAVEHVTDQGGDPQATQPENRPELIAESNQSSEQAKAEQDEVDAQLEAGRQQRIEAGDTETTKLNPDNSDEVTELAHVNPTEENAADKAKASDQPADTSPAPDAPAPSPAI